MGSRFILSTEWIIKTPLREVSVPQLKCTITAICLCIGLNHALAKTHYAMQDFSSEGMLTFSIDLPKTGHEQKLIVRGEAWGLKSQVSQPQC